MGTPRYAERIAILETEFRALKDTVVVGFKELGEKIDAASLNGQTPRVKNMSAALGDPDTVSALAAMVESRNRWRWAFHPFTVAGTQIRSAVLWGGGALALAWLNGVVHSAFSKIP